MTEEIYDNDQIREYYEMFFNNTNGNYVDEDGNLTDYRKQRQITIFVTTFV